MNSFEVTRHDASITPHIAEQLSIMFESNYPESHSEDERCADIKKHAGAVALQSLMNEGRALYVATFQASDVAGFLESRVVDRGDVTYEQLSWIMIDTRYRGSGVATALHDRFVNDAQEHAKLRLPKPSLALLSVHEMNAAERIYQQWGYQAIKKTSTGKIMMVRPLLPRD